MQNLVDSHDTDRLASMIVNAPRPYRRPERFDYDVAERASPRHDPEYDIHRPNDQQREIQRLVALFQLTCVGAPMIYYGTEAGMWGGDDPDDRMPMVWPDLTYSDQTHDPRGRPRRPDAVQFDREMCDYYQRAIRLRQDLTALRRGEFEFVAADDHSHTLAFLRKTDDAWCLVALNRATEPRKLTIALDRLKVADPSGLRVVLVSRGSIDDVRTSVDNRRTHRFELPQLTGAVLVPGNTNRHGDNPAARCELQTLCCEFGLHHRTGQDGCNSEAGMHQLRDGIDGRIVLLLLLLCCGCGRQPRPRIITIWHNMRPVESALVEEQAAAFESLHPEVRVRLLYKETEELRSGFQSAALAGVGPDLVYGPSDAIGPYHTMGLLQDMTPWLPRDAQAEFAPAALITLPAMEDNSRLELLQIGDRVGNHLALVYNRNFIKQPPANTDDMIRLAVEHTRDEDGDGRTDRYGLVWNFTEPFFVIPFLTGYGSWVFADNNSIEPALDDPASIAAYDFVLSLRDRYAVIPANCDYEMADSLFKSGKAAMIINGDWSWGDYLAEDGIDAVVVPLPVVSATGLPMRPMVATKGYSLNTNVSSEQAEVAMQFVRFVTRAEAQRDFMAKLKTLPSRIELLNDPLLQQDSTLRSLGTADAEQPADAGGGGIARHLGLDATALPGTLGRQHRRGTRRPGHATRREIQDSPDESAASAESRGAHAGAVDAAAGSDRSGLATAAHRAILARLAAQSVGLPVRRTGPVGHWTDRRLPVCLQRRDFPLEYVLAPFP